MTLPTIDGMHHVGCHCNDICACSDPIECIHEQCICDRLSAAYQRGRREEFNMYEGKAALAAEYLRGLDAAVQAIMEVRDDFMRNTDGGDRHTLNVIDACIAAARGEGEQA